MSAAPSSPSTAETSLASPPARRTFAERFYWLGFAGNSLLVMVVIVSALLFTKGPWGPLPWQSSFAWGFAVVTTTFVVGWAALSVSRGLPYSWAGLAIPLVTCAPAFWYAWRLESDNYSVPARFFDGSRGILAAYLLILGLLWISGIRLLSPTLLAQHWTRGKLSLSMLVPMFVFVIAYTQAAHDLETDGPFSRIMFGWLDNTGASEAGLMRRDQFLAIAITSTVAIGAFVASLTSYVGWSLVLAAGIFFQVVSSRTTSGLPWFDLDEPKHAAHYLGMISLFTAAMTLPWLLLGWRTVWTPPLWDRIWRKPNVATGEAT